LATEGVVRTSRRSMPFTAPPDSGESGDGGATAGRRRGDGGDGGATAGRRGRRRVSGQESGSTTQADSAAGILAEDDPLVDLLET
jgi:hypothetical protein